MLSTKEDILQNVELWNQTVDGRLPQ